MTELRLRLHGHSFALRGPAAGLAALEHLYHSSVIDTAPAPAAPAAASFEIAAGEGGWRLTERGREDPLGAFDTPLLALLRLEHELEARLLERLDTGVAFHAGAVVTPAGACLAAGGADTGKSSSTLQLVELGHLFLAEEIAAIDSSRRVLPHLQTLAIDPRVSDEIAADRRLERGRLERIDDLLHRYVPDAVATEPAPLATILLPRYRPGRPPLVEEPRLESVATELLGYCFEPPGDPEPAIDRILAVAASARLVRLEYPNASVARRLLRHLFAGEPH